MKVPVPKKLPRPHQVVFALGVLMFFFVLASGLIPVITGWHDDSPIQREVFVNVPDAVVVAFYFSVAIALVGS